VRGRKNRGFILFILLLLSMAVIPQTFHAAGKPKPVEYKEYTQLKIGEILFSTSKAPKQKLLRSKIFFKGKVLKSPLLKRDEIVVYRMVITCCAADALPLGILVKLPEKTVFYHGEWVGVEGMLQLLPFNTKLKRIEPVVNMVPPDKFYPYFTATKAYKVKIPKDEYLYVGYN
jgi:hypothetical protein